MPTAPPAGPPAGPAEPAALRTFHFDDDGPLGLYLREEGGRVLVEAVANATAEESQSGERT